MLSGGPFNPDMLRKILDDVLSQAQTRPGQADLEYLARALNLSWGTFTFGRETGNASKLDADNVRDAIGTLMDFFESRRAAWDRQQVVAPFSAGSLRNEHQLYEAFQNFVERMRKHTFDLDMDAGLLMPVKKGWHDVAPSIASSFQYAMQRSNGKPLSARSNDGPVPRFVAAVVPHITGDTPPVTAVGKFLKEAAKKNTAGTGLH